MRKATEIKDEKLINELLSLTEDDCLTLSKMMDLLGDLMTKVYDSLVEQKVDKEDARGYLPLNVQCGKLFMTFTLRTLFMFLNLRLDTHAQSEVRGYANILSDTSNMYAESLGLDDMEDASKYYSLPKYKREQEQDLYLDIDEEV